MAGIKLHGAIDAYIHHNRIHRCGSFGVWLDWMGQGARISSNLFYHNISADLFTEVDHGPMLVDNNILLSPYSIRENADGIAYVHNLFCGSTANMNDGRYVPYHLNHSTQIKGFKSIVNGDHRYYNNIFIGGNLEKEKYGLAGYKAAQLPIYAAGNLFCNGALLAEESQGMVINGHVSAPEVEETDEEVYLILPDEVGMMKQVKTESVDAARLGKARLSNYGYESQDGMPVNLEKDYAGKNRSKERPLVGPIEHVNGKRMKVW